MKHDTKNKTRVRKTAERPFRIISKDAPFPYVEAYKSLRTNLNFMAVSNEYKKILVTSALPEEGKSNVAVNLAVSLAENDAKVLLVDCDLRKPVLHKYLRINRQMPGITSVLGESVNLSDAIVRFTDINIDVITAGVIPPNPAELLGSKRMEELLKTLSLTYDYIIFDTPPVSLVTDAAVLGRLTDGAIMVIRPHYATVDAAQLAKRRLESAGVNIIGAVLNGFDAKSAAYNRGYYYSYNYNYYRQKE